MNYKGFDKDLKCRGFQYEVGKEYEESDVKVCEKGFHACENPLDVFSYYPPADSRYCEVEQSGELSKDGGDSKVASSKIKIGAEIGLSGLIRAGVKFILEKVDFKNAKESNTGDRSAATNTGNRSAATNTGYQSAATNTGDQSAATNTGNYSAATVEGKNSVAIVTGYQSKAKASLGSAIVVVERGEYDGKSYPIKAICSAIVDGKKIKADTYYTVKDGVFVEVK
jgi:hypothetical protein